MSDAPAPCVGSPHEQWRADRRPDHVVSLHLRRIYQRAIARAGDDLSERDPHGPHDLRHTFSTWLEDTGIPARVIDELMGHERSRHAQVDGGSRVGARHRHTTPEMAIRGHDRHR
ncbi:MAG TPA: tyrosine-type recombinase/integrase [Actinomycetes bacterium]